jgi:MFS family permease
MVLTNVHCCVPVLLQWMAIFMEELLDPPIKGAFWINACSMLIGMTFMLPVAGMISDRVGRVRMMTFSAVALTGLGPVCVIMISKGNPFVAFLCQLVLGVCLSFFGGPLCGKLSREGNGRQQCIDSLHSSHNTIKLLLNLLCFLFSLAGREFLPRSASHFGSVGV